MFREKNYQDSIFIDLDGPLLDVSKRHYRVYSKIVNELKHRPLDKENYWQLKRARSNLSDVLKLSGLRDKEEVFKRRWLDLIERKVFLVYDKIFPGVKNTLTLLKNNYRLILVTLRKSSRNLYWQLNKLDIKDKFNLILCSNSNFSRDDWRIKCKLIKENKYFNLDSWIIGDTEIDILAGKKLKIKTVAVLSGIRNREILSQYQPDFILNSFNEITGVIK